MVSVRPRSPHREDRAGDPLDGLVNLFDLGIVLSVAFLLAALSSLHLGGTLTKHGLRANSARTIYIKPGQTVAALPTPGSRVIGRGTEAGVVYRLADGQLVYVQRAAAATTPTTSAHARTPARTHAGTPAGAHAGATPTLPTGSP